MNKHNPNRKITQSQKVLKAKLRKEQGTGWDKGRLREHDKLDKERGGPFLVRAWT